MAWFKIDDGFYDHPKVIKLRNMKGWERALSLWMIAGSWCSKQENDGRLTSAEVKHLCFSAKDAQTLVSAGLWDACDDGAFVFHDWEACNPTHAQLEAERTRAKERVTKWRGERKHVTNGVGNGGCNAVTSAVTNAVTSPLVTPPPSQPIPAHPSPSQPEGDSAPAYAQVRVVPGHVDINAVAEAINRPRRKRGLRLINAATLSGERAAPFWALLEFFPRDTPEESIAAIEQEHESWLATATDAETNAGNPIAWWLRNPNEGAVRAAALLPKPRKSQYRLLSEVE